MDATHRPKFNVRVLLELQFRGVPPILDKIIFSNTAGTLESTHRLYQKQLTKAVAFVLAHYSSCPADTVSFRIKSKARSGCLVRTILNAKNESLHKGNLHGLANGNFLRLFLKPTSLKKDYLEVDTTILSPDAVTVKLDGAPACHSDLKKIIEAVAVAGKWKIHDYSIEKRSAELARTTEKAIAAPQDLWAGDARDAASTSATASSTTPHASLPSVEAIFEEHLVRSSYAKWTGSADQPQRAMNSLSAWIERHPTDLYARAMLMWSILMVGDLRQITTLLQSLFAWISQQDGRENPKQIASHSVIIGLFKRIAVEKYPQASLVRSHIEDTLVRAALLRWLSEEGRSSSTFRDIVEMGERIRTEATFQPILRLIGEHPGERWLDQAIAMVDQWAEFDVDNGVARVVALLLIGRNDNSGHVEVTLRQTLRWLDRCQDEGFVRWAVTWLAGLWVCPVGEVTDAVIHQTGRWLQSPAGADDRLARMGYLWLVGARGTPAHLEEAIRLTNVWLQRHEEDDFIRLAFLFFVARRSRNPQFAQDTAAETSRWLKGHRDSFGLTRLALDLFEAFPANAL